MSALDTYVRFGGCQCKGGHLGWFHASSMFRCRCVCANSIFWYLLTQTCSHGNFDSQYLARAPSASQQLLQLPLHTLLNLNYIINGYEHFIIILICSTFLLRQQGLNYRFLTCRFDLPGLLLCQPHRGLLPAVSHCYCTTFSHLLYIFFHRQPSSTNTTPSNGSLMSLRPNDYIACGVDRNSNARPVLGRYCRILRCPADRHWVMRMIQKISGIMSIQLHRPSRRSRSRLFLSVFLFLFMVEGSRKKW